MSKFKHTPGPWTNEELESWVMDDKENDICILYSPKTEKDFINAKANAQLIAAAPDMLEMLIKEYRNHNNNGITDNDYEWNRLVKTIIEKATGLKIEEILK